MEKIASFTVNHDILQKGMYVSRIDGDVVTYDIRMKRPNQGDYLPTAAMHTIEHLFATFARNSEHKDSVLYVGPMGCRTGFYLLVRASLSPENAIALVQASMRYIAAFDGEIPGNTSRECGNYLEHDLEKAKQICKELIPIYINYTEDMLYY